MKQEKRSKDLNVLSWEVFESIEERRRSLSLFSDDACARALRPELLPHLSPDLPGDVMLTLGLS